LQLVSKFEKRCIYGEVVGLVRLSLSWSPGDYQGGTTPPWPASAIGLIFPSQGGQPAARPRTPFTAGWWRRGPGTAWPMRGYRGGWLRSRQRALPPAHPV